MTSNEDGLVMICIAALSANMCMSSTSGYSIPTSVAISRHSLDDSITFILSREWTRLFRSRASSKATRTTRSISFSEYAKVSTARRPREFSQAGLKLANKPNPFRSARIPSSGRTVATGLSHFGPPTAPNKTASDPKTIFIVSSGNALPVASIAVPPTGPVT